MRESRFIKSTPFIYFINEDLQFLNDFKDKLLQDGSLIGLDGIQQKAKYLLIASELVRDQLIAQKRLTPNDQQILAAEIEKMKKIMGENKLERSELEEYLKRVAKAPPESDKLFQKCHNLIEQQKLRAKGPEASRQISIKPT